MNRVVRRQELVDEEKRVRIQELRSSGQIVESRKSYDIPFGVRAIQSGVQVDGIWISQSNTPAASELKLGLGGNSPDMITTPESKSGQASPDIGPISPQSSQLHAVNQLESLQNLDRAITAQEDIYGSGTQGSYRPRKASQLRYGSHGEFDQATLQQLEGTSPPRKMQVHRPRQSSSRHTEVEAESSAADNELSSGVSSHSDISLSQNMHTALEIQEEAFLNVSTMGSRELNQPPTLRSSRVEYFSLPLQTPGMSDSDPFETPLSSPNTFRSSIATGLNTPPVASTPEFLEPAQDLASQQSRTPLPFVPGELHVNKSIRKVNSGFEVLPAGTFGAPAEFKGKGVDMDFEEDSGDKRQSTKLQKKPRTVELL